MLGCLDNTWNIGNITVDDIEDIPQIIILSYTHVPKEALYGSKLTNNEKIDVEVLISQIKKYLFSGKGNSKYNLEDTVNRNVINGFINLRDKKIENVTHVSQKIGMREYDFVLKFVDGDSIDSWKCI